MPAVSIALLHDDMVDKNNVIVTTSVTLIDVHDIARSCRTYGIENYFIVHPAETLRALVQQLKGHWDDGFGMRYNPNRKDALSIVRISENLDNAIETITQQFGVRPLLVATSAKNDQNRVKFTEAHKTFLQEDRPILLMFGTGWGMSPNLLSKADIILEPIVGPTPYNHLSVRSAVAIILDRLLSPFATGAEL